ncbi:hypothetical protein GCM10011504_06000 [Siccirubricoccus deserti]|nr:hypothetical protein GCM10011504_06000 [Siccirubricoccus deserti]
MPGKAEMQPSGAGGLHQAMASPCIDVCCYDEATGWCLGCGMTRKDKKHWKKEKDRRPAIRDALSGRLLTLAASGKPIGPAAKHKKKA